MVENVIQIKSGIKINVGASVYVKKVIFGILLHAVAKMRNLASVIDNSVIKCDEIIDAVERKPVTTNFNEKNVICKTKNFCILLAILLISIALLIAASIYCYLIKYKA